MEKMKVDYDQKYDNLFFYLHNNDYEYSEFLNDSVALDFNEDKKPIGVEISDASKEFKIKKQYLKSIKEGEIKIIIGEDYIKVSIKLYVKVHNKATTIEPINIIGDNDFNIPSIETNMVIA